MYDYWLNIVTVRATKDIYLDFKDEGGKKLEIAKGKIYRLYDVCYRKNDFNTVTQDTRYSYMDERGIVGYGVSKYVLNDYDFELIKQEHRPYDIWHVRREDVI